MLLAIMQTTTPATNCTHRIGTIENRLEQRTQAAAGTAIPSCSQVGATSEAVARCMSRGQRKSS